MHQLKESKMAKLCLGVITLNDDADKAYLLFRPRPFRPLFLFSRLSRGTIWGETRLSLSLKTKSQVWLTQYTSKVWRASTRLKAQKPEQLCWKNKYTRLKAGSLDDFDSLEHKSNSLSRSYKNILEKNLTLRWNLTNQVSHVTNFNLIGQFRRWVKLYAEIFFIGLGPGVLQNFGLEKPPHQITFRLHYFGPVRPKLPSAPSNLKRLLARLPKED